MYWLQKIVGVVATPLLLCLLLVGVGLLLRTGKRVRAGRGVLLAAAACSYLVCTGLVGDALLGWLERQYPPLDERALSPPVAYIVILGSGYYPRDSLPITAALDAEALARGIEGLRLSRHLPAARLVFSGGSPDPCCRPADGYARLASELGVDPQSFSTLDDALDTADEARAIAARLGTAPFVLVTSASHMPRAMRYMERVGLQPIAAPTAQLAGPVRLLSWSSWWPS